MIFFHIVYYVALVQVSLTNTICSSNDVHALILARGGSKGIPEKNLKQLNGSSLLSRTITTINKAALFKYIWVSTNNEAIAREALKHGALVYRRSELYAQDETSSLESVKEFLSAHETINNFALFQCTSVFLKERYVRQAYSVFQQKDCVFAISRSHKLRWKEENGKIIPLNFDPVHRPRRQDWDGELVETGMFYFSKRFLVEQNRLQNERCGFIEIDSQDALEIDTYNDLLLSQCLVNLTDA